jgi:hypothetical protein
MIPFDCLLKFFDFFDVWLLRLGDGGILVMLM